MGASHARMLAAEGANVVIADIDEAGGKALSQEIGEDRALFVSLDVTKYENWQQAVDRTIERFGKMDVLINNAGIFSAGSVEDASLADWEKTIAIDLTGTF